MKNTLKEIIKIAVLGSTLVVVQAFAFSEPASAPPGGNVAAPVNVGGTTQEKTGGLIVAGLRSRLDAFLATDGGNVGVGTVSPAAKLDIQGNIKITDGTQGVNRVLTSDANGSASWKVTHGLFGYCVSQDSVCERRPTSPKTISPATCTGPNKFGRVCGCEAGYLRIEMSHAFQADTGGDEPTFADIGRSVYTCLQN